MPAIYFRLGNVQPFADMTVETAEEGVVLVSGDGKLVGLRLDDPTRILDLPGILERLQIDPDRIWPRLRADEDVLAGSRAAKWGGWGA